MKKLRGAKKFLLENHRFGGGIFLAIFIFVFASFGLVVANGEAVEPSDSHLVSLSIDGGVEEIVPSRAETVGDFLSNHEVTLHPEDAVEPSQETKIDADGFRIEVLRAEPTTIVNGASITTLLSPYRDPRLAVEKAGIKLYREDKVELEYPGDPSVSRILGRKLVIDRAALIYVNIYGTIVEHRTNRQTVEEVLAEMSVLPEPDDVISPSSSASISEGMLLSISRFGQQVVNVEEAIPQPTETILDKNMAFGSSEVRVPGSPGRKLVTYELTFENGVEVARRVIQETVVEQPVTKVVATGNNVILAENKQAIMIAAGLSANDFGPADFIISRESGWCATKWQGQWGYCPPTYVEKYAGAETDTSLGFGLCQSTPAIKMATAGSDWRTSAITQLKWCTNYAIGRYGSWQGAYEAWNGRYISTGHGWW